MKVKWLVKDAPDLTEVERLRSEFKVEEVVAYMLVQRGVKTIDDARAFFYTSKSQLHDPFLMKDMEQAVDRLTQAIEKQEKVLIYGDYDVDGTTAVAIVHSFLKEHTDKLVFYIPDRYEEGYGVSEKGINWAKDNDCTLLITLDCGIKAHEKVELANSFGIDVIICDHHTPDEVLPDAIVLNPKRSDCEYPYKELSGAGVGFKFMQAYAQKHGLDDEKLFESLDLLAISIGADIVPVTGENRVLAILGLKQINQGKQRIGIERMLTLAKKEKPLTLSDVVFTIAPRINAAGRLDDAKTAVKLLISEDDKEAREMATHIHELNEERRNLDKQITEEALEMISQDPDYSTKSTTVVYQEEWVKGVVGIVASRLIERHYRPTIVFTLDEDGKAWTGSARSIEDVNIYDVLQNCSEYIERFGGHVAAAGLTVSLENIEKFIAKFDEEVKKVINSESLIPQQIIERELGFDELFTMGESVYEVPRLMRVLKQFEPHGPENMKPVFWARNVFASESRLLKDEHIKMKVIQPGFKHPIDAIFFNSREEFELVQEGPFDMAFTLDENQFRGRTTPQLMVKSIRPTISI